MTLAAPGRRVVAEDQRRAGTSAGHGGDAADPGELQKAPAAEAPVHRRDDGRHLRERLGEAVDCARKDAPLARGTFANV